MMRAINNLLEMRAINKLLDPVRRQIRNSIARGIITLVDDTTAIQRVQIQLMAAPQPDGSMGTETISDIEVFQRYGHTSVPFTSAEAGYVSVGGVRAHGLVVVIDDRRYRPTGLTAGESMLYDDQGQQIYISRAGIVIKGAGLPITIEDIPSLTVNATTSVTINAPQTTCNGAFTATGLITGEGGFKISGGSGATMQAEGNIAVTGGDVTADGIALKGHGHTDEGVGARTSNSVE